MTQRDAVMQLGLQSTVLYRYATVFSRITEYSTSLRSSTHPKLLRNSAKYWEEKLYITSRYTFNLTSHEMLEKGRCLTNIMSVACHMGVSLHEALERGMILGNIISEISHKGTFPTPRDVREG